MPGNYLLIAMIYRNSTSSNPEPHPSTCCHALSINQCRRLPPWATPSALPMAVVPAASVRISSITRQSPSNHDTYPSRSRAEDLQLARLVQYAMDQHAFTAVTLVTARNFFPEYDFACYCHFRCCRVVHSFSVLLCPGDVPTVKILHKHAFIMQEEWGTTLNPLNSATTQTVQPFLLINKCFAQFAHGTTCQYCHSAEWTSEWSDVSSTNTVFTLTCNCCIMKRLWTPQGE